MAQTAANVHVAGTGAVYTAALGATVPTGVAAPTTGWTEVGYTTDGGVTFSQSVSTTDVSAWQSTNPIRTLTTSRAQQIAVELLEYTPANVQLALGGGTLTQTVTLGTLTIPASGDNTILQMIIDAVDGTETFRYVFGRVQPDGNFSTNLQRGAAASLPLTFNVLAGGVQEVRSNATNWHS